MSSEWAASPVPKRMTFAGCVNACPVTNTTRPASRLNRLPLGRILQAVMPGQQTNERTNGQTNKRTNERTDGRTDEQTNKQTHTHTQTHTF